MATVTAGSSQTIILGPGDSLQITTQPNTEGSVVVTPNGAGFGGPAGGPTATLSPQTFPIGPTAYSRLFGPYAMGASVVVSCRLGSITYTASNSDPEAYAWATRPDPTTMPVGSEITITDLGRGGSRWRSDGTNWRPAGGRVTLYQRAGSVAAPINTWAATGAAGLFTLPESLVIPQGLLAPYARLTISAWVQRVSGAVGAANVMITLGTLNTATDPAATFLTNGAANANAWPVATVTTVDGTAFVGPNGTGKAIGTSGAAVPTDRAQSNAANPLYVNIGFNATNSVGDTFALLDYQIVLEA